MSFVKTEADPSHPNKMAFLEYSRDCSDFVYFATFFCDFFFLNMFRKCSFLEMSHSPVCCSKMAVLSPLLC